MKAEDIRDGDIVEIDYIAEFTKEHINEGKALVLWRGFNNQPLIMRLDREAYSPVWSCYEHISKVVGNIPIGEILKKEIAELPPVKQEPKTGHWIMHPTEKDYSVCSCRGIGCKRKEHGENADGTEYIEVYYYRFCPWCGARMVEPQESEIHCTCADEEIAKSFIEDVEAVKDLLPQKSEE
jgi:NADH pyrophosphatase NudC (nudix superfamily)